ncbi:MAG: hypothetical protein A3H28_07440 [Acidobacteria bacterium RIFCSPLOWO2_02_FULL_61_28]|nr:MAG: hypothetical protein A3H28_07440 [Acidobacteria bacterium RIFCSPLOWO2_02_FULL_61_28]
MQKKDDLALTQIKSQATAGRIRVTQHAAQEMAEEEASLDEVLEAIQNAEILEYYAEHRRGPCCLLNGRTKQGRFLHVVCTTAQPVLVLITVYEPKPPKWTTPGVRGEKR